MRCREAQTKGRDACAQPMVPAAALEEQIGGYFHRFDIPTDSVKPLIGRLATAAAPEGREKLGKRLRL